MDPVAAGAGQRAHLEGQDVKAALRSTSHLYDFTRELQDPQPPDNACSGIFAHDALGWYCGCALPGAALRTEGNIQGEKSRE